MMMRRTQNDREITELRKLLNLLKFTLNHPVVWMFKIGISDKRSKCDGLAAMMIVWFHVYVVCIVSQCILCIVLKCTTYSIINVRLICVHPVGIRCAVERDEYLIICVWHLFEQRNNCVTVNCCRYPSKSSWISFSSACFMRYDIGGSPQLADVKFHSLSSEMSIYL